MTKKKLGYGNSLLFALLLIIQIWRKEIRLNASATRTSITAVMAVTQAANCINRMLLIQLRTSVSLFSMKWIDY